MKATKTEWKIINALNAIIHARNLYFDAPTEQNGSYRVRVVNCHFDGKVCVECLYSGKTVQVEGESFSDGNGNPVVVSFTDGLVD